MTETDHLPKELQDLTDHALRDAQASGYSILAEAFTRRHSPANCTYSREMDLMYLIQP